MKPLQGVRVLDLSRILAGPWASQVMADMGAEVIKVERPSGGDDTRGWGPPWLDGETESVSAYFLSCNRGKQSVCIDFSHPRGQALVRELAARSDILLENYRPGSLARHGLDYDGLRAVKPDLIYCSITGFGQDGPYRDRNGYDLLLQAMGGLMGITGTPPEAGAEPVKVGVAVTDILTGLYAAIACMGALRERDQDGVGRHIDLSLMDVQVASLANQAMNYLVGGQVPTPMGHAHPNIVPYQAFQAADEYLVVAVGNDGQFRRLCEVLEVPGLARASEYRTNAGRVRHRADLVPALAAAFRTRKRDEWLSALETAAVSAGPVNDMAQVFADPQVKARGMLSRVTNPVFGELPTVGNPVRVNGAPGELGAPPPALGQHTVDALTRVLQLDAEELASLRDEGIIAGE